MVGACTPSVNAPRLPAGSGLRPRRTEAAGRSIGAMIRIRPGRSWRHNPGYLGKLRRLDGPHLQRFEGGGILDVLGIEVDGVDIAAGVGEAEILVAMDELCAALARLRGGSPAAQATVGRGPTELLLAARGAGLLLALGSLAPPPRV